MRILWVDPVGTADHDAPMATLLVLKKAPGTTVEVVSFASGSVPKQLACLASALGWTPGRNVAGLVPTRDEVEAAACFASAPLGDRIGAR